MRKALGFFFLAAALYFLLPLCGGIVHIGMIVPALAFALLAVWCFCGKRFPRWLRRTLTVLYALAALVAALFLWQMTIAARNAPIAENGDGTVIVLGCKLDGDRPGLMLQNRIDAAYSYLAAHPDAVCVCSGGMDDGVVQADCIARTLAEMGIDPARLYQEGRSENTEENLRFSAQLIQEQNLSPLVVIATDNFHEYRAALYAQRNGLAPFSIGCTSPWIYAGGYWCREMAAILAAYIL